MRDETESPIDTALNAQINQPVPGDGKQHGDFPAAADVEGETPEERDENEKSLGEPSDH